MSLPFVSVIIDTYNHGRFIEEAIDSVLSQDYPKDKMEVLVVDDGSTDDTAERVKKYGARVQHLYKPNGGQASAFNFGFARAQGEIIGLLDGDDTWLPGKLKRIAEEFEKHPEVGMVYHPYLEVDMRTNERRKSYFQPVSGSFFENKNSFLDYGAPGTCASFRRASLARVMPIPESLRSQADGYIETLIAFVAPILAVPECLATYRFHDQNLYHADGQPSVEFLKKRTETMEVFLQSIYQWLWQHGYGRDIIVRSFVGRVTLWHERNKFRINPPGRLRFFWYLVRENYVSSPVQTWKYTLFRYWAAFLALGFGFQDADSMEKYRDNALETMQRFLRKAFGTRSTTGLTRTATGQGPGPHPVEEK